ncbi:MAG: Cof-type HAD-IIB family hydrolase [Anaerobacillus sp.]|uniref:Cof-type HAD-IIB family hydrolase n=1 Tax=Anaerobacillus sp. TaxID=1872506 RepID=UPI00391CF038
MSRLKAIVLDLDGTLLNNDSKISAQTKRFLLEQKQQGTRIILATGRPLNMTTKFHKELALDTPIICLNGALVYDCHQDRVIYHVPLRNYEVDHAHKTVCNEAELLLYHTSHANFQMKNISGLKVEDEYPIEKLGCIPEASATILKISVYIKNQKKLERTLNELSRDFELAIWENNFEITKKSVTKWHSLQVVLKQLEINPTDVIAFGDGTNDFEMIKNVGIGVAMANAIPSLKVVANFITLSNDDDGIIHFIKNYQLNNTLVEID